MAVAMMVMMVVMMPLLHLDHRGLIAAGRDRRDDARKRARRDRIQNHGAAYERRDNGLSHHILRIPIRMTYRYLLMPHSGAEVAKIWAGHAHNAPSVSPELPGKILAAPVSKLCRKS